MERSLLAQLASKFAAQDEVVATDALTFILRRSTGAREAIAAVLGRSAEGSPIASASTQTVAGEESRPDLSLFDATGRLVAYVEAKFWAGLTPSQPVDYLRRLTEQGGRAVLFVVPEERLDSIWAELRQRVEAGGLRCSVSAPGVGARVARIGEDSELLLCSWRQLLSALRSGCERTGERDAAANLDQLAGLVGRFEADGFGPMSQAELSDLRVPRRVRALVELVKAVVARGEATGTITRDGTRETHGWASAGRYFRLRHGNAWLGVDHDAWARYHASPLWVFFSADDWSRARDVRGALRRWEVEAPPRLFVNDDDSLSIPLLLRPGAERDAVVEDVVRQLDELDAALAAAGLTRSKGAPQ
jgi:hypothetical protein